MIVKKQTLVDTGIQAEQPILIDTGIQAEQPTLIEQGIQTDQDVQLFQMTNAAQHYKKEIDTLWSLYKALQAREAELCQQLNKFDDELKSKDIILKSRMKRLERAEHMGNIRAHERGIIMEVLAQLDPVKSRELDMRLQMVGAAH